MTSSAVKFTHSPNSKLLILIRHAESKLNATRRNYMQQPWAILRDGISQCIDPGVRDAPLTPEGQKQAQTAGLKLARDVLAGNLPKVELVAVSPLRRTLHTSRLIVQTADEEYTRLMGRSKWWVPPSLQAPLSASDFGSPLANSASSTTTATTSTLTPSIGLSPTTSTSVNSWNGTKHTLHGFPLSNTEDRRVFIVPYMRERRTTSADQSLVRPAQAVEYWKHSGIGVEVVDKDFLGSDEIMKPELKARTRARLNHFLTVGLTQRCRKVKIESVQSVNRRIHLLEKWLESRPEQVIMLVGHSMIFKAWQEYWQSARTKNVMWASRAELVHSLTKGSDWHDLDDACSPRDYNVSSSPLEESGLWLTEDANAPLWGDLTTPAQDVESKGGIFGQTMLSGNINKGRRVFECPNAGMLLAWWSPTSKKEPSRRLTLKKKKKSPKLSLHSKKYSLRGC